MPKIPVYDRQFDRQSVDLGAPKQSFDTNLAMFGGGDAAGLKSLGGGMADVGTVMLATAKRMKQEEDETKSLDAYLKYHDAVTTYLQGDGSEGSGAYNRLGGSALGLTKEAKEELEKRMREVSGSLANPEQQELFRRRAIVLRSESLSSISRHEAAQRREYHAETYKAVAGKEFDYALLNYTDGAKIESSFGRAEEAVRAAAKMRGLPAEATEKLVMDTRSDALKKIALRLVKTGQYDDARKWLTDDRLTGDDRAAVQDALRPAEVADKADQIAEMMTAKGFDKQSAQKYLMDNVEDLDVRRVAKQTFNALYATRKAEAAQARQEAIYGAIDKVDSLEGNLAGQYKLVNSLPEGPVKNAALRRYKEYARFEGLDFRTDPEAYVDLQESISFAEIKTPGQLREDPRASKVSAQKLKDLERQLQGKQKVDSDALKAAYLQAKGLQAMPTGSSAKTIKADFYQFGQWAEKVAKDTNKMDSDPAIYQKMADTWALQGEKKGGGFGYGADVPFSKAKDDPTWLPDIPDESTQAQIKTAFEAYPDMKKEYMAIYGSEKQAMRGYFLDLIKNGLGPAKRTNKE